MLLSAYHARTALMVRFTALPSRSSLDTVEQRVAHHVLDCQWLSRIRQRSMLACFSFSTTLPRLPFAWTSVCLLRPRTTHDNDHQKNAPGGFAPCSIHKCRYVLQVYKRTWASSPNFTTLLQVPATHIATVWRCLALLVRGVSLFILPSSY